MRRKSFWLSIALAIMIVGSVLTTLALLTQHEPAFYRRAAVPPGSSRNDLSFQFLRKLNGLKESIQNGGSLDTGNWGAQFSEAEIDSFFAEELVTYNIADRLLPEGISEPRVAIDQDCIRLGFRYGSLPWSTIISVDFRVWLAKAEPNVVVLELQGLHAGALPISAQSLLQDISDALRPLNIQVSWYRHQGNPTAALKFQSDQPRPSAQLKQLDLKPGTVTIFGKSDGPLEIRPPPASTANFPTGN